jgi:MarR family transcriptional regulator, 2-MHQ and catechol-resistance regulon repressor
VKKPVDTSGVHVWLIVWKAYEALAKQAASSIKTLNMNLTDFAILELLLHKGAQPINAIGAKLNLTSGSMTTAIDRLTKRGLVERMGDQSDRRTKLVELTAAGKTLISKAFKDHKAHMDAAAADLSVEERERLISLLKKLGGRSSSG